MQLVAEREPKLSFVGELNEAKSHYDLAKSTTDILVREGNRTFGTHSKLSLIMQTKTKSHQPLFISFMYYFYYVFTYVSYVSITRIVPIVKVLYYLE